MKFTPHKAFTVQYDGLASVLHTQVALSQVAETDQTKIIQAHAIWDTGATNCTITKSFAAKLGLTPISKTIVKGVHGDSEVNVYLIDLLLPNYVKFTGVRVTECVELSQDGKCAMLIGMDVIRNGDMAISNKDKKTIFSFRIPSQEITDYVKEHNHHMNRKPGPNFTPPKKRKKKR